MKKIAVLFALFLSLTAATAYSQSTKLVQTGDPAKRGLKESD